MIRLTSLFLLAIAAATAAAQDDAAEVAGMFVQKGEAALKKNDADGAIENVEKALKRVPDHAFALDGLGRALPAKGRTDDAVDAWTRAKSALEAKVSPSMSQRNLLDSVKDSLKKHDLAGPEFAKVADTLADLASKWFAKKRYGAARRAVDQALALDPTCKAAKAVLEKLDAVEGAASGGKDLMSGEDKWSLVSGKDVKRADDGIACNGTGEPVHVQHPGVVSGDAMVFVTVRIDKLAAGAPATLAGVTLLPSAAKDATAEGSMMLLLRTDKDGPSVQIHVLEGQDWKKSGTSPLAVPVKEGAAFDLDIRLRAGAAGVIVSQDGRRVGECGAPKGAPAEFKIGVYAQGGATTFTAARLKSK